MDQGRHTVTAVDTEKEALRDLIAQMGRHAGTALEDALDALLEHDADKAARVVTEDDTVDALEEQAEDLALRIIALRAPFADDLREVMAVMKIASMVERIGDYAKSIARRVPLLAHPGAVEAAALLPEMARVAIEQVRDAIAAFTQGNAAEAVRVTTSDQLVDAYYDTLFRSMLTYMAENPQAISQATHLLFIAKHIERVGDQATNIAEVAYFAVTGEKLGERPRGPNPASAA